MSNLLLQRGMAERRKATASVRIALFGELMVLVRPPELAVL